MRHENPEKAILNVIQQQNLLNTLNSATNVCWIVIAILENYTLDHFATITWLLSTKYPYSAAHRMKLDASTYKM
jgi:hemerythrin